MSPSLRRRSRASTDLPDRLGALDEVVQRAEGHVPDLLLADARTTLARAGERLRLSAEHTVVALAGATGSGKSSLFNAVVGLELSPVGVRRPTTGHAHACVWGEAPAGPLLDWLEVHQRVSRGSELDAHPGSDLAGLVLLDLPDHDSTHSAHRLEVDRLVEMVDLLVWVLDPQKYADRALHEHYLRRLAGHSEVTVIVLNQVDRLDERSAADCLGDLRRLLAADGLPDVPVLSTSAVTGAGLDDVRTLLAETVAARQAAGDRIAADVDDVVADLTGVIAPAEDARAARLGAPERDVLVTALAGAAGVPVVASAVERAWHGRTVQATGLPWTRWVRRLRPDPLRRLHLEGSRDAMSRSSLPAATPVQRSRVDTAVRRVADVSSEGMPATWVDSVRSAARSRAQDLPDALDRAVVSTDLGVSRTPTWWAAVGFVQLVLAAAVVVGLGWLLAAGVISWFGLPSLPLADLEALAGTPLPTALALGGLLLAVLLAAVSRVAGRVGARRRRRAAERRLRAGIGEVADEMVLAPVQERLDAYREVGEALTRARR